MIEKKEVTAAVTTESTKVNENGQLAEQQI